MPIEFDKQERFPALDLHWEETIQDGAGGELHIIKKTKNNDEGRTIIENSGAAIGELSDVLVSIVEENDELPHALLHGCCWHALRDLASSMYLAMSGRYRQANILHRSALEVAAQGLYFEFSGTDDEFEAWLEGKGGEITPDLSDWKTVMDTQLSSPFDDDFSEDFGERWGKLSTIIHTLNEGDVEKVMIEDQDKPPLVPWSAYFDMEDLKQWYENFITDIMFIGIIIADIWEPDPDVPPFIASFYEDIEEGRIANIDGEIDFEL